MKNDSAIFCTLCGSGDTKLLYPSTVPEKRRSRLSPDEFLCTGIRYGEHDDILRCGSCGFIFSNHPFSPEQLLDAYSQVVDERYIRERPARMATFRRSIDLIHRHIRRGRILDVGCYTGYFLEVCRNRGWDAAGVEPSHWAVEQGRGRGLNIFRGALGEADFEDGSFDAVTLWDVLEHFSRPGEAVRTVNRLLKPGGYVFATTFDISGTVARILGPRYPMYARAHLGYFSIATLYDLLKSGGFISLGRCPHQRYVSAAYLAEHTKVFASPLKKLLSSLAKAGGADGLILRLPPMGLITMWGRKSH